MKKLTQCLNCQWGLPKEENFCPNCGQKNHATKNTWRSFLSEVFNAVFNLDERLWVTFKTAIFNIGDLAKEFNQGKRRKYVRPIQFYLFCSVLYFLFLGLSNQRVSEAADTALKKSIPKLDTIPISAGFRTFKVTQAELKAIPEFTNAQMDSLLLHKKIEPTFYNRLMLKQTVKIMSEGIDDFMDSIASLSSTGMFLLVPFFGWLLYLFLASIYPYYIEHLVFSVYLHGVIFLILSLSNLIDVLIGSNSFLVIFIYFLLLGFILRAIKQFYGLDWLNTIGYSIILLSIYSISLLVVMMTLAFISILII